MMMMMMMLSEGWRKYSWQAVSDTVALVQSWSSVVSWIFTIIRCLELRRARLASSHLRSTAAILAVHWRGRHRRTQSAHLPPSTAHCTYLHGARPLASCLNRTIHSTLGPRSTVAYLVTCWQHFKNSLGPFHEAIAVPSVTRCRCRGHRTPPAL